MLGILRRLWHAHIAKQDALIAGLQALRSETSEVRACLSRIDGHLGALIGAHQAGLRELKDTMLSESLGGALHNLVDVARSAASSANHDWARLSLEAIVCSMAEADGRNTDPLALPRYFAQVYSQDGADGIITEIFRRIGTRDRTFLEIGIENGTQNNTRFLLEQGWRGVWIEANPANAADAADRFSRYVASGHLRIVARAVEPNNVEAILSDAGVPPEFDFLSLDIDQHTTHVWRSMHRRARVACLEYNASIPPTLAIEVPYRWGASWEGTNWFGGGLKVIEQIGAQHSMHLVGCDPLGINTFLVSARETGGLFREPFTAEAHYQPPRFGSISHIGHPSPKEARALQEAC